MASFVVMEPPTGGEEDAVLVRDGFHFFAFLVPFIWLLVHRLWIEAAVAFAAVLLIGLLGSMAGIGAAATILSLLVAILVGMEGAALRLAALRRRGWREWGVVEADDRRDAEIRYLAEAIGDKDDREETPPSMYAPAMPARIERQPGGPALGLFGYPGRH